MWIVKRDERRWNDIALSLNIHIAGIGVPYRENMHLLIIGIALLREVFARLDRPAADGNVLGSKIQAQYVRGIVVESRIRHTACVVGDLRYRGKRTQQM